MTPFSITQMQFSTVLYLHSERESLQLDPDYQRESDIWPIEKRQLLVDSIINGYDIPKIYFHKFPKPKTIATRTYTQAIIDGKQRLTSIWQFIDGSFALSDDIEFIADGSIDLRGLTYVELGQRYPKLKLRLDSYPLSVAVIETDEIDLIEDMFSRLNEAVPLSAAEKRNAFGGVMPDVIRRLARTAFCRSSLPFGNKRYRHYDLIAKFLLTEEKDSVVDTKKLHLDNFVRSWRGKRTATARELENSVSDVMAAMTSVFTNADPLLRSVGMLVLYYHVFRSALNEEWDGEISRRKFVEFESARIDNRVAAETDLATAEYDLLEFDRHVQTPNDSHAIGVRLSILLERVFDRVLLDEYLESGD